MPLQDKPFARLSSQQWQQIINQQLESGLSQKDFCRSHQISLATFSNWKRKLNTDTGNDFSSPDPALDKDWIALSAGLPEPSDDSSWHMELELPGGVILRMRR